MFEETTIIINKKISYLINENPVDAIKRDLSDGDFIILDILNVEFDKKKEICYSMNICANYISVNAKIELRVLMNCPNNIIFIKEGEDYQNIYSPTELYSEGRKEFNCGDEYKFLMTGTFLYKGSSLNLTIITYNKSKNVKAIELIKKINKKNFEGIEISNPHRKSISILYNEFIPQYFDFEENSEDFKSAILSAKKNISESEILAKYGKDSKLEIFENDDKEYNLLEKYLGEKHINIILPVERPLLTKCVVIEPTDEEIEITREKIDRFKELINNLYNLDVHWGKYKEMF